MADVDKPRRILAHAFHEALMDTGVIRRGDYVRRVVIDARAGEPVIVHIERYGDERLLQVVRTLDGMEVREQVREVPTKSWAACAEAGAEAAHELFGRGDGERRG